jgi:hypothetical protein
VYYGDAPVQANLDFVEVVGGELGRVGAKILDSIRFGIMASVNISTAMKSSARMRSRALTFVLRILRLP